MLTFLKKDQHAEKVHQYQYIIIESFTIGIIHFVKINILIYSMYIVHIANLFNTNIHSVLFLSIKFHFCHLNILNNTVPNLK